MLIKLQNKRGRRQRLENSQCSQLRIKTEEIVERTYSQTLEREATAIVWEEETAGNAVQLSNKNATSQIEPGPLHAAGVIRVDSQAHGQGAKPKTAGG